MCAWERRKPVCLIWRHPAHVVVSNSRNDRSRVSQPSSILPLEQMGGPVATKNAETSSCSGYWYHALFSVSMIFMIPVRNSSIYNLCASHIFRNFAFQRTIRNMWAKLHCLPRAALHSGQVFSRLSAAEEYGVPRDVIFIGLLCTTRQHWGM